MTPPTTSPALKPQEIPFDNLRSDCYFVPTGGIFLPATGTKPFLATPAAVNLYGLDTIIDCLKQLQMLAKQHDGIDYLQVFTVPNQESLWFIEDGEGGAITALLPSDY